MPQVQSAVGAWGETKIRRMPRFRHKDACSASWLQVPPDMKHMTPTCFRIIAFVGSKAEVAMTALLLRRQQGAVG